MIIRGIIDRQLSLPRGTPGKFTLENGFSCDTLELPWASNKRGISCTAPGTDHGRVWQSPSLKRKDGSHILVVRFEPRNGRYDCLIHNGNWAGEGQGMVTQVHGCTEVGRGFGDILRPDKVMQWGILHSLPTLDELLASLRDLSAPEAVVDKDGYVSGYHGVEVEYMWQDGCEPVEDVI